MLVNANEIHIEKFLVIQSTLIVRNNWFDKKCLGNKNKKIVKINFVIILYSYHPLWPVTCDVSLCENTLVNPVWCWCKNTSGDVHGKWWIKIMKYPSYSIYFINLSLVVTPGVKPMNIIKSIKSHPRRVGGACLVLLGVAVTLVVVVVDLHYLHMPA